MSRKFTIAIIAGQLVVGGAERQLYLWLSHLDRERFQPVVLTLHPEHGDYWENPIRQLSIPLLPISQRPNQLMRLLDIVRVLRLYNPDLIHGWHSFASPYAGMAGKLLGVKSLGGLRDSYRIFWRNPVVARLTLLLVDALLVNSHSAANDHRAVSKAKEVTIYTVQNAVEDQAYDRLALREELSQNFGFLP